FHFSTIFGKPVSKTFSREQWLMLRSQVLYLDISRTIGKLLKSPPIPNLLTEASTITANLGSAKSVGGI
ncbi:MAG TPA: hypothetical protein VJQ55_02440, partial [Candidatus Binatia bacterium]|nr:hypothetical protein [Candidatus Binatia bacterium]